MPGSLYNCDMLLMPLLQARMCRVTMMNTQEVYPQGTYGQGGDRPGHKSRWCRVPGDQVDSEGRLWAAAGVQDWRVAAKGVVRHDKKCGRHF